MSITIKCKHWLDQHTTVKQWLWFVTLWFGGLLAVTVLTLPLKLLMKVIAAH